MEKIFYPALVFVMTVCWGIGAAGAAGVHAGNQAVKEAGQASAHASASAANALISSGQVTSAASAVPLAIGGSVGAASTRAADELMNSAAAPIGQPLDISEESVTIGPPPDKALAAPPARPER